MFLSEERTFLEIFSCFVGVTQLQKDAF